MIENIKPEDYNDREKKCRAALDMILAKRQEYREKIEKPGDVQGAWARQGEGSTRFWKWVDTELVPSLDKKTKVNFLWKFVRATQSNGSLYSFQFSRTDFRSDWKTVDIHNQEYSFLWFDDEKMALKENYYLHRYDMQAIALSIRNTLDDINDK